MAPSKKCFPLQPGAFFRFSRIFKLSQSACTSNLPFSKMWFLPERGAHFCFFPLLMTSTKKCKSNLSAFPPFLNASWGLLGSPWNSLGPSWRQLCAKLGQLGANLGELLPNWGQLGPTWANLWPILHESLPYWAQLGHRKPEQSLFFIWVFQCFLFAGSHAILGPTCDQRKLIWGHVDFTLGSLWPNFVHLGANLGAHGATLAPTWALMGLSWRQLGPS